MKTRTAVLVLGLALLAACAGKPSVVTSIGVAVDTGKLLETIARHERETKTLSSLFRATVTKPDGTKESSRGALVVAPPDRFRLQIFSLGVLTVYDFTVDGDRFRVRLPLEGREEGGDLREAILGRDLLRFDLRPLFLGRRDPLAGKKKEDAETIRVFLKEPDGAERVLEISKAEKQIVAERFGHRGTTELVARYSDFRAAGDVLAPYRIDVEYPTAGVTLEIDVESLERNVALKKGVFDLPAAPSSAGAEPPAAR